MGVLGLKPVQPLDSQRNSEVAARTLQLNARAVSRAFYAARVRNVANMGQTNFIDLSRSFIV